MHFLCAELLLHVKTNVDEMVGSCVRHVTCRGKNKKERVRVRVKTD